jgi:hypothetical protein
VWETNPSLRNNEDTEAFADVWSALPKVVFSRTLDGVQGNARLAEAPLAEEVAAALDATDKDVYSMALCHTLTEAGHTPRSIKTSARSYLRMVDGAPTINQIDLETEADAPGLDEGRFREPLAARSPSGETSASGLSGRDSP